MAATTSHAGSSKASSSGASSSSESDSSSSHDSASDSDSEFGEVSQEYLDSLLAKAKENMRAKSNGKGKEKATFGDEEIKLQDDEEASDATLLPSLDPGKLPYAYFDFEAAKADKPIMVKDVEVERLEKTAKSTIAPAARPTRSEVAKDGRKLTKKEMKAEKQKTAERGWFDLPAHDAADLPRLYREVEALRLRNSLDPKRFYRKEEGEGKGIKGLPEQFAIGTIVPTSTPFGTTSGSNLTRAERKRTLVDELVDDSEAKRYAKKKFEDLQSVRGARGRGTLAKRNAARKPKW